MHRLLTRWDKVLFALGLLAVVFLGGVAVGKYQVFPYAVLNDAKDAAMAVVENYRQGDEAGIPTPHMRGGVVRWDDAAAQPGLTLVLQHNGSRANAVLLAMDGTVLHRWQVDFATAFPEAPHIRARGPEEKVVWHGFHLFPNGDLLFNMQGANFPAGGGAVLLDKGSRVKWALPRNTHHDLEVLPDGRIYLAGHRYTESGIAACAGLMRPPYYEDVVFVVTAEGRVADEISVLEALCASERKGLLTTDGTFPRVALTRTETDDPLHLNNVDVVTEATSRLFPMAAPGDVLVSMRNLNAIAFLDTTSRGLRWLLTGPFVRQHDPDLLPNGNLLVFDNLGGDGSRGGSRVLEIEPVTQRIVWRYEGGEQERLESGKMGNQQLLPNGNVLVTESLGGRVVEVTRTQVPRIVWEYINLLRVDDGHGIAGIVSEAKRYPLGYATFLTDN
jgi:hypothetical protein